MFKKLIKKFVFLHLIFSVGLAFSAVQSIQPEAGMWAFENEVNGKPGRGVQIDKQNSGLIIVTYFGYRPDGSALFLQSSGVQSGNSFEADLFEYRGGTVIGQPRRDGEAMANYGKIKLSFNSPVSGSLILPGEVEKKIYRFQFEDNSFQFNNHFVGVEASGPFMWYRTTQFYMTAKNGLFSLKTSDEKSECVYEGIYHPYGVGIYSSGSYACKSPDGNVMYYGSYITGQLKILSGIHYIGEFFLEMGNNARKVVQYGMCQSPVVIGSATRCAY